MARTEALDRKKIIASILRNNGIVSAVAKEFDVSAYTIYNYRNKYASVAEAINEARHNLDAQLLDGAELKLNEAIRSGEAWAIKYVLDNKGTARGYKVVTRQEVQNEGTTEIVIRYADHADT